MMHTLAKPVDPRSRPEAMAGWITPAEARAILDVNDGELRRLVNLHGVSRRTMTLFYLPEIRALRDRG
jgi:hypothetical protein